MVKNNQPNLDKSKFTNTFVFIFEIRSYFVIEGKINMHEHFF